MRGKEAGQSTPDGPMIRAFELDAALGIDWNVPRADLAQRLPWEPGDGGQLPTDEGDTLISPKGDLLFTIEGLRTDYGRPDNWEPGRPNRDAPDRTSARRVEVQQTSTGETLSIRDIAWDAFADGDVEAHIHQGRVVFPNGEWVELRTGEDEPLHLSRTTRIELQGVQDTKLELAGDVLSGFFSATLNGNALGGGLDCANADQTIAEVNTVILSTLPQLAR